jgi:hypothetical protein
MKKNQPSSEDQKDKFRMIVVKEGRIFPGGGVSGPTVIMPPGIPTIRARGSTVPPLPWQVELAKKNELK